MQNKIKSRSGWRSGAQASTKSRRPFTFWRDENIRCELCGEEKKFDDFDGDSEVCTKCAGGVMPRRRWSRSVRRVAKDSWVCRCGVMNAPTRRSCRTCLSPRDWLQGVLLKGKKGGIIVSLKMPVNAPQTVPEGKHFGQIDKLEVRDFTNKKGEIAQYLDVHLTCEGEDAKPKAGYPANISPSTLLGKLLTRFGAKLEIGGELDVETILTVGLKVQYVTSDEDTPNGTFSRVDRKSLRPFKG